MGGGSGLNPVYIIPSPRLSDQKICPPSITGAEGMGHKVGCTVAEFSSCRNVSPETTEITNSCFLNSSSVIMHFDIW